MTDTPQVARIKGAYNKLIVEVQNLGYDDFIKGKELQDNPFAGVPFMYKRLVSEWEDGWFNAVRTMDNFRKVHGQQSLQRIYEDAGMTFLPGYVYVLSSSEAPFCKIGRTTDLKKRLTARGEWFSLHPDDVEWLRSIVAHKYGRFHFRDDYLPSPYCYSAKEKTA